MSDTQQKLLIHIDMEELAARIGEACMMLHRPQGVDGVTALRIMRDRNPVATAGFQRAAAAAVQYLAECYRAVDPSVEVTLLPSDTGSVS